MSPTPFEVTADQIIRLGRRFATFVNKLLEVERVAQGLPGHLLTITANENAPDAGVDAALRGSGGSVWVPAGDSAWQFKRVSLSDAQCADELAGATGAHAILKGGGSYVIALGGLNVADAGVQSRRKALIAKAVELELLTEDQGDRLRVYDANAIARWASVYPGLAIHPILEGVQVGAIDFERWRASRVHVHAYSADEVRASQIGDLRARLEEANAVDVRLQGDTGIGKTRLALEALDDPRYRSLVAYIDDESQVGGGLIESLIDQGRHAIVVVDDCPAERHIKLTAKLPTNPAIKLITIGDVGSSRSSGPVVGVGPLTDDAMDALLGASFQALSNEARRFVRDHSHGAPGMAIWLAAAVQRTPDAQAADMIARDDIELFITEHLPEGADFFFAAVLALFERVGWDRDRRSQMELLAEFSGADPDDLERVVRGLATHNLVRAQGRYRAIEPLPVAIYLAAEGWRQFGQRIIDELIPKIDDDLAVALFRRLAQLGRFEPARAVLPRLLAKSGPFGDLRSIEEHDLGPRLTQLAIVLPDEVVNHLSILIEEASVEQLARMHRSRRDMVWTLEKLVWHTHTFERAADALLKLALAENETYANNATGTWLDLFGAALPGTAASPGQRTRYLERVAADPSPEVRQLAVRATQKGLQQFESITVSGEVQGGVLVEPRGSPATWSELADYRRAFLHLLDRLRDDVDASVSDAAARSLLDAVHPLIDDPLVGGDLSDVLATFDAASLRRLRVQIEQLLSLHERHDDDDRQIAPALRALRERLPAPSAMERLEALLDMQRWDLGEDELQSRMTDAVRTLTAEKRIGLTDLLAEERPAAWELGRALALVEGRSERLLGDLASRFEENPNALVGYLRGLVDDGHVEAFDAFLDGPHASALDARAQLAVAVRGPVTDVARARVRSGAASMPIGDAASAMFGWGRNLSASELADLVDAWSEQVETQQDYNSALDWVNLSLEDGPIAAELFEPVWRLVARRRSHPDVGREGWDWARLMERVVVGHEMEVLVLLLDLIENDRLMVHSGDEDAKLLSRCVQADPVEGWREIANRLERPEAWRLSMLLRGWIQFSVPVEVLDDWIGTDLERSRLLASIANPGAGEPTPLAVLLLGRFGDDDQVASSLRATFASGTWTGPWSARITNQIEQLTQWQEDSSLPLGVRKWARATIEGLIAERESVLEREAERGY